MLALLAGGCASAPLTPVAADEYRLTIVDNPGHRRFDLTLEALGPRRLCIFSDDWPTGENFDGAILRAGDFAATSEAKLSWYCPGGCGDLEIRAGAPLRGTLPYSAFGDPDDIAVLDDKALTLEPHLQLCTKASR
jgi:hypothetical protein